MPTLAVIPARGGSKGIPRKNLVELNGLALIAWTIRQAQASGCIDYVHVSTDDPEIADVAKNFGASCDFLRPKYLAGDSIGTGEAILHSIERLQELGKRFDLVLELQPTYCFRGSALIKDCVEMLLKAKQAASAVTCAAIQSTAHPDYALGISETGFIDFGQRRPDQFARQLLAPRFACHGLVLVSRIEPYMIARSFFGQRCLPVVVNDPIRLLDINDSLDLEIARCVAARYPSHLA